MVEKLSRTTEHRLSAALDTWRGWPLPLRSRPSVTEKLQGLSNESFTVSDGNVTLVLRLNGESERFGVDRGVERTILTALYDASFAPSLIYRDADMDFIVTTYVRGHHIAPPDIPEHLVDISTLFTRIHNHTLSLNASLDPLAHAAYYHDQLSKAVAAKVERCYKAVMALPISPRIGNLCHHDLLLENILSSGGRLIALDWEYARIGDPAFDLAVFLESYALDDTRQTQFLDSYEGPAITDAIDDYRLLYRLIEVLWWMLKDPASPEIDGLLTHLHARLALE